MNTPLPRWAAPSPDLAVTVEFSRMVQAALCDSTSRRYPTSVEVVELVGDLTSRFVAQFALAEWGETHDFLEATEQFFDAADKPDWWPTEGERAARAELDYLVALARRVQSVDLSRYQALDDEAAIAQAVADDEVCDAAGKRIVVALSAAGFRVSDYGDGIVEVHGWRDGWELRVCVGVEHDPDGDHLLVDIIGVHPDAYGDAPVETALASSLPVEDLDLVVEQVRDLFRDVGGAA